MQAAIEVVKEVIFTPLRPPQGMPPTERQAWFGEMGLRREAYLGMLHNFLMLAELSPRKANAQELQKKKPWEVTNRENAGKELLKEIFGDAYVPSTGATGASGETTLDNPYPPPEQQS